MSLNAASIRFLLDKGLDGEDLFQLAEHMERRPDRTAAERQQRQRDKKRHAVTVTRDPRPEDTSPPPVPFSDENGGNAAASSKTLFDTGVAILTGKGIAERQARSFVAKCQRDFGNGPTLDALNRCQNATEPISAVAAILGKAKRQEEYHGV